MQPSPQAHPVSTIDEVVFFRALGIGKPAIEAAALHAATNGTSIECEIIAHRCVTAETYYEALAAVLGLPYLPTIPPETVIASPHVDAALARPRFLRIEQAGRAITVLAPDASRLAGLKDWIARLPGISADLAIAAPATIREAVWACRDRARAQATVRALFEATPSDSARIVLNGSQGLVLGAACASAVAAAIAAPGATLTVLHVILTMLFASCILLRLAALVLWRKPEVPRPTLAGKGPLPVYSVLVALHHEGAVAGQLVAALKRLRWPRSLIEIKLVCEADDVETLTALEALDLPPEFEVVRVPPMEPRTKPKALHYALNGVSGTYLVIYDAEDRPHPDQLLEAHAAFAQAPERLAFLQAPLVIHNGARNSLTGLFAIEYAALFRGLLPALSRFGLPLPLGGTSNHFRISALRECGAWDPHNVTEDADLGLRLFRRGYRGGVLSLATLEEAPETLPVWMRQRTRWFKGWLQTWLVMMRSPLRLRREMGTGGFTIFQVLIAGLLCSALAHPLLILFLAAFVIHVFGPGPASGAGFDRLLFGIDLWNLFGGYLVFLLLGHRVMIAEERRRVRGKWSGVFFYWLAMSAASWLALYELVRKPFYWAKTPHVPCCSESEAAADLGAARRRRARFVHPSASPMSSCGASTCFDSAEYS